MTTYITEIIFYVCKVNVLKAMSIVGVLLLTAFKLAWLRTIQARLAPLSACVERAREIARNEFFQDPLDISQEDEVGRCDALLCSDAEARVGRG